MAYTAVGLFHEEKNIYITLIKSQLRICTHTIKKLAFFFQVEYNIFIQKGAIICQKEYIRIGYRNRKQQEPQ